LITPASALSTAVVSILLTMSKLGIFQTLFETNFSRLYQKWEKGQSNAPMAKGADLKTFASACAGAISAKQ
jgi:hypothetical protein